MSPGAAQDERTGLLRAARGGLCGACSHARLVTNARGSVFLRCTHPDVPKYLPQPVWRCHGFAPLMHSGETPEA